MADSRTDTETAETAKHAVGVAVAGALAAGLGGAAKAMLERRSKDHTEPAADAQDDASDDAPDDGAEAEAEVGPQAEEQDEAPHRPQPQTRQERKGAAGSRVAQIVGAAREHLEALLGSAPESVSGIERVDGTWYVTLEVVELRRIPDSTDVLSSYEVVVDDDGDLIRLERRRRYQRAQVEEDG
jgi:gas vesicle protein GvpO